MFDCFAVSGDISAVISPGSESQVPQSSVNLDDCRGLDGLTLSATSKSK